MLRVVHILEAFTGGTRRHLRDLVLGLPVGEFGQDVIVSLRRDPAAAADLDSFRAAGIGVHVLPMRRRLAPLSDLVGLARLVRLVRRLNPDIVHCHSSKAGFLGRLAARLAGAGATVYTPHAFAFAIAGAPIRRRLYRLLERRAVPWTDRLIAVSQRERELALAIGYAEAKIACIPNGIAARTEETPATRHPTTVGFLGRLGRQKGADLFVAAIPGILRQVPTARFRIVGDGPWRRRLERQVARRAWRDRVAFTGAIDEAGVAAELAAINVLVLPSRWEGLSYTLLDALQAGVPVVATDVGGVADVDGDSGCIVVLPPEPDAQALAGAVAGVLGDAAAAGRRAAAGRSRAVFFSLDAMIGRTAAVYGEAAARV